MNKSSMFSRRIAGFLVGVALGAIGCAVSVKLRVLPLIAAIVGTTFLVPVAATLLAADFQTGIVAAPAVAAPAALYIAADDSGARGKI